MFLQFFGRDFSSDVFFVDMYFPIFLLGKCLLRDVLVGVSLQFFCGECLEISVGRNIF